MTEEDFLAWRDHPVTQWVMKAVTSAAQLQKEHWLAVSWDGEEADQRKLDQCRVRADAYMALIDTDYERFCELNGQEPE